jgi:hypothetical protein
MRWTIFVAAAMAAVPSLALATPNTACPILAGEQAAAFPGGVPAGVVAEFNREFSPYALPGRPFNATDVVHPGPRLPGRRVVFARHIGPRWVIALEQGGEDHNWFGVAYQASADGRSARKLSQNIADGDDLCTPVERMLRGNPATPAGLSGK